MLTSGVSEKLEQDEPNDTPVMGTNCRFSIDHNR